MSDIVLRLTEEEREVLRQLLDSALAESRVEAHRTHFSPWYREQVLDEESCIAGLLKKLGEPVKR
jgi:Ala-tRNA(Pro) deacylase